MLYLPVRCVVRFNNTDFPGGDVVEMTLGIWVVSHGSWKEGEVRGFPGFGAAMMLSNRLFHRKSLFSREWVFEWKNQMEDWRANTRKTCLMNAVYAPSALSDFQTPKAAMFGGNWF